MEVEYQIEDAKTNLAQNPNFNCEDAFRLFESNDKDYLTESDIKNGLNSIGVYPTDQDVRLLMKRFDLQKNGNINYADFFDIIVPFEKEFRNKIRLSEAAEILNVSPEHMCRLFKKYTDMTFNEYLMSLRISAFYQSLNYPVEDYDCGNYYCVDHSLPVWIGS